MTINQLIEALQTIVMDHPHTIDYDAAVWVRATGGSEAFDVIDQFDIDDNDKFIGIYIDY